jgi:hypothetical protein
MQGVGWQRFAKPNASEILADVIFVISRQGYRILAFFYLYAHKIVL